MSKPTTPILMSELIKIVSKLSLTPTVLRAKQGFAPMIKCLKHPCSFNWRFHIHLCLLALLFANDPHRTSLNKGFFQQIPRELEFPRFIDV